MLGAMRTLGMLVALALLGCGGASDPDAGSNGMDAQVSFDSGSNDAGSQNDARTDHDDAGATEDAGSSEDAGSVEDGGADAGAMEDAGTSTREDAGTDAGTVTVDLGPVMCRSSADCGSGQNCDVDAPGGRCQGCTGSCAGGGDLECLFGACLRNCGTDADCNAGMTCANFAGDRYCRPRDCADCPAPYTCRDGECSRPLCDAGTCPAPLVCAGSVCVEP